MFPLIEMHDVYWLATEEKLTCDADNWQGYPLQSR